MFVDLHIASKLTMHITITGCDITAITEECNVLDNKK